MTVSAPLIVWVCVAPDDRRFIPAVCLADALLIRDKWERSEILLRRRAPDSIMADVMPYCLEQHDRSWSLYRRIREAARCRLGSKGPRIIAVTLFQNRLIREWIKDNCREVSASGSSRYAVSVPESELSTSPALVPAPESQDREAPKVLLPDRTLAAPSGLVPEPDSESESRARALGAGTRDGNGCIKGREHRYPSGDSDRDDDPYVCYMCGTRKEGAPVFFK